MIYVRIIIYRKKKISCILFHFLVSKQYVTDPVLLEELRAYRRQNEELLRRYTDLVEKFQSQKINSLDDLIDNKKSFEKFVRLAHEVKPVKIEGNNLAFFGTTSTGKSTIINRLLNSNAAKTGYGETTTEVKHYPGINYVLWDIPGKNDQISYLSMEYVGLLKALSRRIILINTTMKENSNLCKLLDGLQLHYSIAVNKFDIVDDNEKEEFKKQIHDEIQQLNLRYFLNQRLYFISAKFPQQFRDWFDMVNYLTSPLSTH